MSNTLTNVIPQLLAQGLLALRQNAIMPRLVNTHYESLAAEKGSSIDVPIPSAVDVQDVTPAATPATNSQLSPTKVTINLNNWKEAPFTLSDKEMIEAMDGTLPMQASEAIKALANQVDSDILSLYKDVYGKAGSAGVTPFGTSVYEATQARKVLNNQLAPLGDRRFVVDADAEANLLGLRQFQDMNFAVSEIDIKEGKLPKKLGFVWAMDQNVPSHTAGTLGGCSTTPTDVNGVNAVGAATISLTVGGTNAMALKDGDIITIAGDTQTYVVTADTAGTAGVNKSVPISPTLQVATTGNETVTLERDGSTYAVNLAFHRDAIAFASRPLADNTQGLGNIIESMADPISGLTLRLEVSREHKRTRFSYDILYGYQMIRAPLACRIHG